MFRRALVLLLLALGAAAAASPEVLRLDADSFEPAVASRPFVAVAFVAPWCAHCKRLEPEWRAAASKLAARGRNIALATLDTTAGDANAALAARHDVRGFPSIRIFRDGDSRSAEEYVGPRAADGVVATLERLEAKAETFIHTIRDAEAFVNAKPVVVLGVFDGERDEPLARAFGAAARAFADDPDAPDDVSVPFGVVASAALVPETDALLGDALNGDVLIYRAFETRVERFRFEDLADTKKSRDERVDALTSFVSLRATPRVAALTRDPRSRSVLRRVFADPGPKVIGFADDESTRREMAETMARVAEEEEKEHISNADAFGASEKDAPTKKKTRARFVVGVAAENANAMRFFDVDPERLPAVVIHDTRTDARYVLHDASDADALAEWLAAFRAGTLAPTVRSAGDDDGAAAGGGGGAVGGVGGDLGRQGLQGRGRRRRGPGGDADPVPRALVRALRELRPDVQRGRRRVPRRPRRARGDVRRRRQRRARRAFRRQGISRRAPVPQGGRLRARVRGRAHDEGADRVRPETRGSRERGGRAERGTW